MQKKEVFFKTDFAVTEQCETGYSMRFRFRYFTSKLRRDYVASFDGEKYENCRLNDDGSLTVTFDDHRLGIGDLMVERHYYLDDERFRTGQCDMVVSAKPVLQFDKEAAEGERISQVVLTPDGAEDFECQSVVEPYWMYGGFGEAAYRNEEERKKNEQERQAAEVTRSNEWTTWFEAVVAAWAAWFTGVKGDWSLWFKQISDAWTAWFDGRKREWSAWFKAVSDYWAEWFNSTSEAWTTWFEQTKTDVSQWFAETKQTWTAWFSQTKTDVTQWFTTAKDEWATWFAAAKAAWLAWFTATKQEWVDWFAGIKQTWTTWFGETQTAWTTWFDTTAAAWTQWKADADKWWSDWKTKVAGEWTAIVETWEALKADVEKSKTDADAAAAAANEAKTAADEATQNTLDVTALCERATDTANTAAVNADKQTAECKTATDLAEELNAHPQMQGENGNWWKWNTETDQYEDTGIIARGGAMYPRFRQRRNHVLMYDDASGFKNRASRRRNHAVIKF